MVALIDCHEIVLRKSLAAISRSLDTADRRGPSHGSWTCPTQYSSVARMVGVLMRKSDCKRWGAASVI